MKCFYLFLISVIFLFSCNKGFVPEPEEEPDMEPIVERFEEGEPYLGKWKLCQASFGDFLTYQFYGQPPILDYFNQHIIYEFKEDGVLIVSGELYHPDMEWYIERGLHSFLDDMIGEGSHLYSISEIWEEPLGIINRGLLIDNVRYFKLNIDRNYPRPNFLNMTISGAYGSQLVQVEE